MLLILILVDLEEESEEVEVVLLELGVLDLFSSDPELLPYEVVEPMDISQQDIFFPAYEHIVKNVSNHSKRHGKSVSDLPGNLLQEHAHGNVFNSPIKEFKWDFDLSRVQSEDRDGGTGTDNSVDDSSQVHLPFAVVQLLLGYLQKSLLDSHQHSRQLRFEERLTHQLPLLMP